MKPGLGFKGGLMDLPDRQTQERAQATAAQLARGHPAIFEATFVDDGAGLAVDIQARKGRSYTLIEVKPSAAAKDDHLWDAAFQAYVLPRARLDVDAAEIMHLGPGCRSPNPDRLFVREVVSGQVKSLSPRIPALISARVDTLEGTGNGWPKVPTTAEPSCPRLEIRAGMEVHPSHVGEDQPGLVQDVLNHPRQCRSPANGP